MSLPSGLKATAAALVLPRSPVSRSVRMGSGSASSSQTRISPPLARPSVLLLAGAHGRCRLVVARTRSMTIVTRHRDSPLTETSRRPSGLKASWPTSWSRFGLWPRRDSTSCPVAASQTLTSRPEPVTSRPSGLKARLRARAG